MLDKLISEFNKPVYGDKEQGFIKSLFKKPERIILFTPILNDQGQSKLAEYILKHGWKWSLE